MKRYFLFLIMLLVPVISNSQNFTLRVSPNTVHVGQRFEISYTIDVRAGGFKAPSFSGIRILSGPNQSQSMSYMNGKSSIQISYSFIAVAQKEGNITIPAATINADGKTLKSNSAVLEVLPETEAQKKQKEAKRKQEQTLQQQALDILERTIFVELNVNKREVFEGEQIVAEYKLYIHPEINIASIEAGSIPVFEGFWAEEVDLGQINYGTEYRDGEPYRAAVIKKMILTPQRAGKLKVDPFEFDVVARLRVEGRSRRSNDPFADFFNDPFFGGNFREFPYHTSSGIANINVKQLPENAPKSFNGAVGNLNADIWFDKTDTKTGEPVTLKIKVSGKGNLKLLSAPEIEFPPSFELYDPKITDNVRINSSGMSGDIIFEYLAIPRNPGDFEIGPVEFSYFNTETGEYETKSSEKYVISVAKGSENEEYVSGVDKSDVELIGKDVRFIKTEKNLERDNSYYFGSVAYYIFNILPLLIFFGFLYYRKKNREMLSNTSLVKNKKASKVAKRRLADASKYLKENNKEKLYEELSKALWGYVSDKLTIPVAELTKDKTQLKLTELNVDESLSEKLLKTIDHCEYARYAPGGEGDMQVTYKDSEDVIIALEGKLK